MQTDISASGWVPGKEPYSESETLKQLGFLQKGSARHNCAIPGLDWPVFAFGQGVELFDHYSGENNEIPTAIAKL